MSSNKNYTFRKNNLKSFLLNPYIISIIITVVVITISPDLFQKYEIISKKKENIVNGKKVIFEDVNNDNKSEKLTFLDRNNSIASYILQDENGAIIDQYNLTTRFVKHSNFWFQDINKNGLKELYLITQSNDSIFLNIHEHFIKNGIWQEKIFIDKLGNFNSSSRFSATHGNMNFREDIKINEIIFGISAGFSLSPRSIFKYNYLTKEVKKSSHLINTVYFNDVVNLANNDYKILSRSLATSNDVEDLNIKKSDYTSWLFMLNSDLSFSFDPIDLKSKGRLKPIYVEENSNIYPIFLFQSLDKKVPSKLIKINLKGKIIKEHIFLDDKHSNIIKLDKNRFAVYNVSNGFLSFFNSDLNLLRTKQLETNLGKFFYKDINNDGTKEWFFIKNKTKKVFIYDSNLEHKTEAEIQGSYIRDFGYLFSNSGEKQFYIISDNNLNYYAYLKNKYYYLKYLFFIGLYFFVLLVVFTIIKGQQYRDKAKRDLEKKILELQLKTIKNQVDSHFVFNSLNTISEMSLSGNKIEIDNFISSYSKFMRITLENSDKIATTIKKELAFVENFLELQQIKYKYRFNYEIAIGDDVNQSIEIPKNVLFTYVENAIKYGLPEDKPGKINISLRKKQDEIIIIIEDNGNGLVSKKDKTKGTGNGLEIIDKIFTLFKERFKRDINHSLENVTENQEIKGTRATIKIRLSKKNN